MHAYPRCAKCDTPLTGEIDCEHVTACPRCGKRWRLTDDHKAIQTTTLQVHGVQHAAHSQIGGSNG